MAITRIVRFFPCLLVLLFFFTPAYGREKIIGALIIADVPYYREIHTAFVKQLTNEGVLSKGEFKIIVQSPADDPISLINAARKLVAIGSSVIITYGASATLAALNETSDMPIVFAGVPDPEALGIAGRNATGINSRVPAASLVKDLKGILNFSRLGVIYYDAGKDASFQIKELRRLESVLGFRSVRLNIRKDINESLMAGVDALFLTTECISSQCIRKVRDAAQKARIPVVATTDGGEESGILLTLFASGLEQGEAAAGVAAQVLKGARPSSIQIVQPRKIDMIINLKTATAAGLRIPSELLSSATRVIR